jgi:hypothetical protein
MYMYLNMQILSGNITLSILESVLNSELGFEAMSWMIMAL